MHKLSPSFGIIEARLQPDKDAVQGDAMESIEIHDEAPPISRPVFISDSIDRTIAARAIKDTPVEPGAVVLVTSIYSEDGQVTEQLRSPVAFCLDAKKVTRGDISEWTGWMVSPDCDYATEKDVLLEPDDGPFDPLAGMVQAWNRLTLRIPSRSRVLAKLSDYRLSIVREVEAEGPTGIPPRPGHIALRVTSTRRTVLTGSPLRPQNDLRIDYRQLYATLAQAITVKQVAPARETVARPSQAATETGGLIAWLLGHRMQMAGFAATLAGVMVAAHMLLKEAEAPGTGPVQVARNEVSLPKTPDAPVTPPGTSQDTGANEKAAPANTNITPPRPMERTELAKLEAKRKPKPGTAPVTELAKGETDVSPTLDKTELASLFLTPLKDQSFTIAMRGTGPASQSLHLYRLRLKAATTQEAALELLDTLGLKVTRIDEAKRTIDVVADKKIITPELETKLKASALFVEAKRK